MPFVCIRGFSLGVTAVHWLLVGLLALAWGAPQSQGSDEGGAVSGSESVVYGFLDEMPGNTRVVDAAGADLPEWEPIRPYLAAGNLEAEESDSFRNVLIVPDALIAKTKARCEAILEECEQLATRDQREPICPVERHAVETCLMSQLTDPQITEFQSTRDKRRVWRCGFAGDITEDSAKVSTVRVSRLIFIPPLAVEKRKNIEKNLGVFGYLIDCDGEHRLPFVSLRIVGDEDFVRTCRLKPAIDLYLSDPRAYRVDLLTKSRPEACKRHEGLRLAVDSLAGEARHKSCDIEFLRSELASLGLNNGDAGDAARELATKSGKRVIDKLLATLNGSNDPLIDAMKLLKYRVVFSKSVSPPVLEYASTKFAASFAIVLSDDKSVYLCQVSAALQMHSRFLMTQRLLDESMNFVPHSSTADALDEVRQSIVNLSATDFPHWEAAGELIKRLPAKPSRPTEPVDPFVAAAQRERAAVTTALRQQERGAFHERRRQLELESAQARAEGDLEGFFDAQAAIGASAALEAGDARLARQYGSAAEREAAVIATRRQQVSAFERSPVRVEYPSGYESNPRWIAYLTARRTFPARLAAYKERLEAYDSAVRVVANELEPVLKSKQAAAIAELDRFCEFNDSQMKRVSVFIKSRGRNVLGAPEDDCTGWYIPDLSVLIDGTDIILIPVD